MLRACTDAVRAFRAEARARADTGEPDDAGGLGGDGGAKFTDDKGVADDIGDVGET